MILIDLKLYVDLENTDQIINFIAERKKNKVTAYKITMAHRYTKCY